MQPIDVAEQERWVGRERRVRDLMDPFRAAALAALLDRVAPPGEGEALPLGWHWIHFLDVASSAGTGPDGHPARGGFLPPVPLPRRMWAAGRVEQRAPLIIGRAAERVSRVASVAAKPGRSGPLVFVTLAHRIEQGGATCVEEEQVLVFREAGPAAAAAPAAPPAAPLRTVMPDPVTLFRYSALTNNAHRIHYDQPYATAVEGYPGLVVHGPLIATWLVEAAMPLAAGRTPKRLGFRAERPAFADVPLHLCGRADADGLALWSEGPDGVGMRAELGF